MSRNHDASRNIAKPQAAVSVFRRISQILEIWQRDLQIRRSPIGGAVEDQEMRVPWLADADSYEADRTALRLGVVVQADPIRKTWFRECSDIPY